jgi:hypothetical protein
MTHLDGNAIGGLLGELFGAEMTIAVSTCDGCGQIDVVAELVVYTRAPGVVVRCPGCDNVLMRVVRKRERYLLDLRGTRSLELPA